MHAPSPFDILAETYDEDFTTSAIGRLQRKRVWSLLTPLLKEQGRPLSILEINCGTGEDAIQLAMLGHKVTATDASAIMIKKAVEKTTGIAAPGTVEFIVCPFNDLKDILTTQHFDLVFSNFGGLNCVDKKALEQLGNDLLYLLQPGVKLFFVVLGRFCLWEIFYYGLRGNFKTAFRRWGGKAAFTVNEQTMPVYYYSPAELRKLFDPGFRLQQKNPVGLFIPPSYLETRFKGKTGRLNRLDAREKKYGYPFFSSLADHYCAIFKKQAGNA